MTLFDAKKRNSSLMKYPDWWLKELIEYDKLEPQPERK